MRPSREALAVLAVLCAVLLPGAGSAVGAAAAPVRAAPRAVVEKPVVTGTLLNSRGGPVRNGEVSALRPAPSGTGWVYVGGTRTDQAGAYRLPLEADATVRLEYEDVYLANHPTDPALFWPDAPDVATAQAVTLASGEQRALDVQLLGGAHVTGTVTGPDGAPSVRALLTVDRVPDPVPGQTYRDLSSAVTDAAGHYDLAVLPTGSYRVHVEPRDPGARPEWVAGSDDEAGATPVDVPTPGGTTSLDVGLRAAAVVRGTLLTSTGAVPPQTEVDLQQQSAGAWKTVASTRTGHSGAWTFGQLDDGTYRVHAFREGDQQEVTSDTVTATAGHDQMLALRSEPGGSIAGRVTASDGKPVVCNVVVFRRGDDGTYSPVYLQRADNSELTRDGSYLVGGLTPGTYRLLATGYWRGHGSSGYRTLPGRFWRHATHLADATDIAVSGTATVTGISPVLDLELRAHRSFELHGRPRVGQLLTTTRPDWRAHHLTVRYRWFADHRRLPHAHGPSLRLTPGTVGHHVYAVVVGHAPGYVTGRLSTSETRRIRRRG